jgi:hypothetical protein
MYVLRIRKTYCVRQRSLSVALEKAIAANKRDADRRFAADEKRDGHPLNDTRYCNAPHHPIKIAADYTAAQPVLDTKQDSEREMEEGKEKAQRDAHAGNWIHKLNDVEDGSFSNDVPDQTEMGNGNQEAATQSAWEDDVSEAITMLIRALVLISAGKSQELRTALIDGCAPMLCDLADKPRLVRWCEEVHKKDCNKKSLFPAIRVQMAQEILRIFSSRVDGTRAEDEVQTSQTDDNTLLAEIQMIKSQVGSTTRAAAPTVPKPEAPASVEAGPGPSVSAPTTAKRNMGRPASPPALSRESSASRTSASHGTDAAIVTPRSVHLTPRMQAGIGVQLASDADSFPIIVEFDACYEPNTDPSLTLELGWRILSVDSQHTQHVALAEVYKWLQVFSLYACERGSRIL